ncbi:activator protein [Candidatus Protofrankia californiensis]|uniref:Activator protein n=1 Tax=Candidatus Protofrankia californiensis TaxID=1839754 RepID=A0A1C3NYS0_9ACTN|nr:activator protein [Candidatus Protofrankia californiensis]
MIYEILGSLRMMSEDGVCSFISARKIECLLAVLLVRADQVVTRSQLIAEIWSDESPRRAKAGLHVYASQLRKFLCRIGNRNESQLLTRAPGYLLQLGDDELDARAFARMVEEGNRHLRLGHPDHACLRFENALALFRGPVLGDLVGGPIIEGFVARMRESRLDCLEVLVDTQLELGRHRELVGRLQSIVVENPLREAFYYQLMLALYRSRRAADALVIFQRVRAKLREELDLEPGPHLQELHRAILRGDQRLDLLPRTQHRLGAVAAGRRSA